MVVLNEALVRVKTKQEDLQEVKSELQCCYCVSALALHVSMQSQLAVLQSCADVAIAHHTDEAIAALCFTQT
jgi:hypothetical protein